VSGQDSPPARHCSGCGALLSRYNPGTLCQACTSTGRDITAVSPENVSVNGQKIRELRRAHGMTQQLLADRAGVSLSYIEKLERGATKQPSVGTLTAIAAALNVPLDTLLHQGPRPAPAPPGPRMHAPASAGYRTLHAIVLRHMEQHGMSLRTLAQAIDQDPSTLSRQLRGIKPMLRGRSSSGDGTRRHTSRSARPRRPRTRKSPAVPRFTGSSANSASHPRRASAGTLTSSPRRSEYPADRRRIQPCPVHHRLRRGTRHGNRQPHPSCS
jgi:DNA-binding XRE family transcriptional regulator